MKKRKEQLYNDPWDRDIYETGSTRPPKNHGGIIAVLLIMVIVLGGLTTGLGLLNIRLFHMLESQKTVSGDAENPFLPHLEASVSGDNTAPNQVPVDPVAQTPVRLGVECVTVSTFDRRYYRLPDGCLVMDVDESGCAARAGIATGDVIVTLDGTEVGGVEKLSSQLKEYHAGETVKLTVYRSRTNEYMDLEVTLDEWRDE